MRTLLVGMHRGLGTGRCAPVWNTIVEQAYLAGGPHGSAGFHHHTLLSMHRTDLRRAAVILAVACAVPCTPLTAQQPTTSLIPASAADTIEIIITARATDSVRIEKDRLLGDRRDAETRWAGFRDQAIRLQATISELKDAISAATAKEKLAKKDKRDADRIAALADKRRIERSLELVEARHEVREAQAEEARIHRDFLDASVRADDAELEIAERRDQVVPNDPSQRTAFEELTSRWLQAQRTRSARSNDLEDRRFKVVEAQIALLKRQRN